MNVDTKIVTNPGLLTRPGRILTEKDIISGYVSELEAELKAKAKAIHKERKRGILGIAAVQLDKPEAICIVKCFAGKWITLINPVITDKSSSTRMNYETCISFKDKPYEVLRYDSITVRYLNTKGKCVTKTFKGKVGRRVQHEIDHINGKIPTKKQFERGEYFVRLRGIKL